MKHYFDNAATTAMAPEVNDELYRLNQLKPGNSSSVHSAGVQSALIVEKARAAIAGFFHAEPDEIIFTSGGTEGNNWVIQGIQENENRTGHLVISAVEHPSVIAPAQRLEKLGWRVTRLRVSSEGIVSPDDLKDALKERATLVSIMAANNEVGSLQDLMTLGSICREKGVLFHTDATQAAGKIPINLSTLPVDFLTISAHKFHGPLGVGALFMRKGTYLPSFFSGGAQERGLRAGTLNHPGIHGMALALQRMKPVDQEITEELISGVLNSIPGSRLNGPRTNRLPGNAHFTFPGIEGKKLLHELDRLGFIVSVGSACSSRKNDPSHVLVAMGRTTSEASASVRVSLGCFNTRDEIQLFIEALLQIVTKARP